MKIRLLSLLVVVLISYSNAVSQKKLMLIDEDLKTNSTTLEAKAKGIGTIPKYHFGEYKIASGKAGWITGNSKSRLFSFTSDSKSKQKLSFSFINFEDTVLENASVNTEFRDFNIDYEVGEFSLLLKSKENFIAFLKSTSDTSTWNFICNTVSGADVQDNFKFSGVVTNGIDKIEIHPVTRGSSGKEAMMKMIIGYEFVLNNKVIAAVQAGQVSLNKKYVWLNNDLTEDMKLILAASAATVMVMVDGQENRNQ